MHRWCLCGAVVCTTLAQDPSRTTECHCPGALGDLGCPLGCCVPLHCNSTCSHHCCYHQGSNIHVCRTWLHEDATGNSPVSRQRCSTAGSCVTFAAAIAFWAAACIVRAGIVCHGVTDVGGCSNPAASGVCASHMQRSCLRSTCCKRGCCNSDAQALAQAATQARPGTKSASAGAYQQSSKGA